MKTSAALCVLLLAAAATASPLNTFGRTQRQREQYHPDRDVEEVEPVRTGGPRGGDESASSDESPEVIPFGIGLHGIGGLAGPGGRPILAVRPIGFGPRDSSEEDADSSDGGFLHPYLVDPMSGFMAQMAEMMAAMRRQMNQVLHRLPAEGTDFSKLGNTTSSTKVVDGHVITVNDTVIGGNDGDDSEIHIRVVDIHPSESPEGAASAEDSDDGKDDGSKGSDDAKDGGSKGSKVADKGVNEDAHKDVEPLSEATPRPNRADNEIPMKVGSEVDDLNA